MQPNVQLYDTHVTIAFLEVCQLLLEFQLPANVRPGRQQVVMGQCLAPANPCWRLGLSSGLRVSGWSNPAGVSIWRVSQQGEKNFLSLFLFCMPLK